MIEYLLQPLFPGESGVDQLVEIIKVTISSAHVKSFEPSKFEASPVERTSSPEWKKGLLL